MLSPFIHPFIHLPLHPSIHPYFFLKHFRISGRQIPLWSYLRQYVFPKIKSNPLNNYYIIPQIRKLTLMRYFYLISDFIQISVVFIMLLIAKEKSKSGIESSSWHMLYLVDHLSVPFLVMVVMIIWWKWYLRECSIIKLLFFPVKWISILSGDTLKLWKSFVALQNFTPHFSIHYWWFLPESVIMMVSKWSFSNSILSFTYERKRFPFSFLIYISGVSWILILFIRL